MTPQDREALRRWLVAGCSYDEISRLSSVGLVGNVRFSENARRAFLLLWHWAAHHATSAPQEKAYRKCGAEFVNRRIARCRAKIAQLKA